MTRTDQLLLAGAAVAAIAAVVYWRGSAPAAAGASADALGAASGLPPPQRFAIGTRSPDGKWVVTQSRQPGATVQWSYVAGLGSAFS